jgi:N-acetylglucosamine-6-phosphate deacetylase
VIVAAGHSNATYDQSIAAVEAGCDRNHPFVQRHVAAHLARAGHDRRRARTSELICGIIVDGHHVSPTTLKIALRCKPPEQLMLVTDAMPSVGNDVGEFMLQGRHIRVVDGICRDEDGTIAGSHLDMAAALANCVKMLGTSVETAACMAAQAPAAFLGLGDSLGVIAAGYRADLVALDDSFGVTGTWIGGAYDGVVAARSTASAN